MSRGTIAVPAAGMRAIPEALAARARDAGVTIETGGTWNPSGPQVRGVSRSGPGAATPQAPRSSWRTARPARPMRSSSRGHAARGPSAHRRRVDTHRGCPKRHRLVHTPRASRSRPGSAYCSTRPTTRPTPWSRCRRSRPSTPPRRPRPDRGNVPRRVVAGPSCRWSPTTFVTRWKRGTPIATSTAWKPSTFTGSASRSSPSRRASTPLPDPDDPEGPVVLAGDYTEWSSIQVP